MTIEGLLTVLAAINAAGVFGLVLRFWKWSTRVEVRLAVIEAHTTTHAPLDSAQ